MSVDNTMPAAGTTIKVGATAIANVTDVGGLGPEMGERDASDLASAIKVMRPTVPDMNTFDFTINYKSTETTHQTLFTDFFAKTEATWTLTFVNGDKYTFDGWIKKFAPKVGGLEDTITAELSIRVTTTLAYTAGP